MGNGWLTPDTAPGIVTPRCLLIPDDPQWIAIVTGALLALTFPHNFEQYGTSSVDDTVAVFVDMFDNFCIGNGGCRVIGEIVCSASGTNPNPANWLACDGSSYLRASYPDLFSAIGTAFGAVDGTHFNVPDLQGRTPVGVGSGSGLTPRTLGDVFGEETHTLTVTELAAHTHTDAGHTHTEITAVGAVGAAIVGVPIPSAIPGVGSTGVGNAAISTDGGDGAHNNIQPSIALSYFIVAL